MDEHEENFKDIFRYTDVEYTPDGYTDVYRWDDFLVIAGDHVYSAMDTIDSVSPGGEYEGFDPQYAYTCEIVGCGDLFDGCALFRPVSHDGEDYIQIAFLRSDIDDSTGEYTERFEAGSFDMPAADALRFDLAVDLMDYFSGRTFEGEPGVSRGLEPREAVAARGGSHRLRPQFLRRLLARLSRRDSGERPRRSLYEAKPSRLLVLCQGAVAQIRVRR